jgi:Sec-independent protein secretion pathway component TatC
MVCKLVAAYRYWTYVTLVLIAAVITPRSDAQFSATIDE